MSSIIDKLSLRFTSGNTIPVERSFITKEEYVAVCCLINDMQYRIDTLMLEHCPDEMTDDQLFNWELHQVLSCCIDEMEE